MPIAVTTDCDHAAWIHLLSFSDRPLTPAQALTTSSQAGRRLLGPIFFLRSRAAPPFHGWKSPISDAPPVGSDIPKHKQPRMRPATQQHRLTDGCPPPTDIDLLRQGGGGMGRKRRSSKPPRRPRRCGPRRPRRRASLHTCPRARRAASRSRPAHRPWASRRRPHRGSSATRASHIF